MYTVQYICVLPDRSATLALAELLFSEITSCAQTSVRRGPSFLRSDRSLRSSQYISSLFYSGGHVLQPSLYGMTHTTRTEQHIRHVRYGRGATVLQNVAQVTHLAIWIPNGDAMPDKQLSIKKCGFIKIHWTVNTAVLSGSTCYPCNPWCHRGTVR